MEKTRVNSDANEFNYDFINTIRKLGKENRIVLDNEFTSRNKKYKRFLSSYNVKENYIIIRPYVEPDKKQ